MSSNVKCYVPQMFAYREVEEVKTMSMRERKMLVHEIFSLFLRFLVMDTKNIGLGKVSMLLEN